MSTAVRIIVAVLGGVLIGTPAHPDECLMPPVCGAYTPCCPNPPNPTGQPIPAPKVALS